jgi:hypothetical protein
MGYVFAGIPTMEKDLPGIAPRLDRKRFLPMIQTRNPVSRFTRCLGSQYRCFGKAEKTGTGTHRHGCLQSSHPPPRPV